MFETRTLQETMNGIRNSASPSYQSRVPELNDTNFREFATGLQDPVFFNEWHKELINRIGLTVLKTRAWDNPLRFLKRGELRMGEAVQEIYIALIDAHKWENETSLSDAGKLYKTEKPDVTASYHIVNREDVYEVSHNRAEIEKAFISERTLEDFVLRLIERLYTSDMLDEYLYMKELINIYDKKGLFHYVEVDGSKPLSDLIVQVRSMSNKFTFISDKYTGLAVDQHCPKDEQVILISSDLDAEIDVNVLASAFNMDKTEFLARRVVLDDLGVEDGLLALVSRDWFMVYDKLREMHGLFNEQTLEIKYFYHVHQLISTSLLENAVLFTSRKLLPAKTIEIDEVTDGEVAIAKGQWFTFTPEVLGEDGTATDVNQAILYQLDENAVPGTRFEGNRVYVDLYQEEDFSIKVSALHDKDVSLEFTVVVS